MLTRQQEYELLSGKVKPEFGNQEHIKLVQKFAKLADEFDKGKEIYDMDISARITIKFNCCKCGFEIELDAEDNNAEYFDSHNEFTVEVGDTSCKCSTCKTKYDLHKGKIWICK